MASWERLDWPLLALAMEGGREPWNVSSLQNVEKERKSILPLDLQKECSPTDILIFNLVRPIWTSVL